MSTAQPFHVNLLSEDFHRNRDHYLRLMRQEAPVYFSEETQHWCLTKYDDVLGALKDSERFSSQSSNAFVVKDSFVRHLGPLLKTFSQLAVLKDPPEHTRLRRFINRAFHPSAVKTAPERTRILAHWLIDEAYDKGEMDFMNDYAYALPTLVFAEILGLERSDLPMVKTWAVDIAFASGRTDDFDIMKKGQESLLEMWAYLEKTIEERKRNPKEDFITFLVKAWHEEHKLEFDEVIAQVVLLLNGGQATTPAVISSSLLALFKHPDQLQLVKDQPELLPKQATEEFIRYVSPAQTPPRVAADDIEVRGKHIKKGVGVMPMVGAANRDPDKFRDPDRLDILREENPHIGFGSGAHGCPGTFLARTEIPIAFEVLFERIPDIRPKGDEEHWNMNLSFPALMTFPVVWEPK